MSQSLSCYNDDFISNHPALLSPAPGGIMKTPDNARHLGWKQQTSIDVMGHNNMTIMSLTTTHAGPGGLLLTPIMWCNAVVKILRLVNITLKFGARSWHWETAGTADKLSNLWTVQSPTEADIIKTSRGACHKYLASLRSFFSFQKCTALDFRRCFLGISSTKLVRSRALFCCVGVN